jgi:hypothetical protein
MTYRVIITPNFYDGTLGAPKKHYARQCDDRNVADNDISILEFNSDIDATEWIETQQNGTYLLSAGEFARPTYNIISASNFPSDCVDALRFFNIYDFCKKNDCMLVYDAKEIQEAKKYMDADPAEDEWESLDVEFAIKIRQNDTYIEVFVVRELSLQLYAEALSNIFWEGEIYFKKIRY